MTKNLITFKELLYFIQYRILLPASQLVNIYCIKLLGEGSKVETNINLYKGRCQSGDKMFGTYLVFTITKKTFWPIT